MSAMPSEVAPSRTVLPLPSATLASPPEAVGRSLVGTTVMAKVPSWLPPLVPSLTEKPKVEL